VGCRREVVGVVTESGLQVAEEAVVRRIDQGFGHEAEGLVGGGPQLRQQRLDTAFTVFGGRQRGWVVDLQHGCRLAVKAAGAGGFPTRTPAYPPGHHFPPKFLNRTHGNAANGFWFATSGAWNYNANG